MVYVIHLSDGKGFCKRCGDQATLSVRLWNVLTNQDALDCELCLACYLGQQLRLLLTGTLEAKDEKSKGQAA